MKFFILETEGDDHEFVEVDGEMVDIGEGAQAFISSAKAPGTKLDAWRMVDLVTGARLTGIYGTKEEAIEYARDTLAEEGLDKYMHNQAEFIDRYGASPALLS